MWKTQRFKIYYNEYNVFSTMKCNILFAFIAMNLCMCHGIGIHNWWKENPPLFLS